MEPGPRRLLVVSATLGERYDAAASALEERARRLWPDCEIRRVDMLAALGGVVGRLVERRPWLAELPGGVVSAVAGLALAPTVAGFRPDLVVSTYPLGARGTGWLRRRGRLSAPTTALLPGFAPHPSQAHPQIDQHYVAGEPSLRALWDARPEVRGAVGAPPVMAAFQPSDRTAARRALDLPADGPVVVIAAGARSPESLDRAVNATLVAHRSVWVVVACGRDETLRSRWAARDRVVALGWTDRMPRLLAAADMVITDAGSATAREAQASGRAVLCFEPAPGQGVADALMLQRAGLGRVCPDALTLTATLHELLSDELRLAGLERAIAGRASAADFDAEVAGMPLLPRPLTSRPLDGAEAVFLDAEAAGQWGAVVMLGESGGASDPEHVAAVLRDRLAARSDSLALLRRTLVTRPGRRARWVDNQLPDPSTQVSARAVDQASFAAIRDFFAERPPLDRPPWRVQVLRGRVGGTGRTAILISLHHALGDERALTATVSALLADDPAPNLRPVRDLPGRLVPATRRIAGLVTGWRELATAARTGPSATAVGVRRYALATLPAHEVRAVARKLRTNSGAVLLGVLAEALCGHKVPAAAPHGWLRTSVASATLDLPVASMDPIERIALVTEALAESSGWGRSSASRLVVRAIGRLPAGLRAEAARRLHDARSVGLIASVPPSRRRALRVLGVPVSTIVPVLPLTGGAGLAVGFLSWGDTVGVGVTSDAAVYPDAEGLADAIGRVFDEVAARADALGAVLSLSG